MQEVLRTFCCVAFSFCNVTTFAGTGQLMGEHVEPIPEPSSRPETPFGGKPKVLVFAFSVHGLAGPEHIEDSMAWIDFLSVVTAIVCAVPKIEQLIGKHFAPISGPTSRSADPKNNVDSAPCSKYWWW